jgi:hypothetical protein
MGDERLKYSKGATLIVTPRGEVWLCDGRDLSRVFAWKGLRPELTSVRLRLYAAIPEASAAGGRVLAVWDRIVSCNFSNGTLLLAVGRASTSAADRPPPSLKTRNSKNDLDDAAPLVIGVWRAACVTEVLFEKTPSHKGRLA